MTFHFSYFPCSSMPVHFVLASPLIRGILCAARSRPLVLFPVSATFTLMYVCVCNIKFIFKYSIIHFALYVYFLCVYKCKRESARRTGIFTEMLTFNCHSCGCALSRVYAMETFRWLFLRVCMFKWMHLLFSVLPACRVSMRTCHGTPTGGHLLSPGQTKNAACFSNTLSMRSRAQTEKLWIIRLQCVQWRNESRPSSNEFHLWIVGIQSLASRSI